MPAGFNISARRTSSLKKELPPSMIVSPEESSLESSITESSVGCPAGTMSQTARGAVSLLTISSREVLPLAPSLLQRGHVVLVMVEDDALVLVFEEAAYHVGTHLPEADHS